MEGTPDYNFGIDAGVTKLTKKNDDLLSVYLAAMVKYALEDKGNVKDTNATNLAAIRTLLVYAQNPANHVKNFR